MRKLNINNFKDESGYTNQYVEIMNQIKNLRHYKWVNFYPFVFICVQISQLTL